MTWCLKLHKVKIILDYKLNTLHTSVFMFLTILLDGEPLEIPAHRVIVAARCDWFRRALLSGMKESIQK